MIMKKKGLARRVCPVVLGLLLSSTALAEPGDLNCEDGLNFADVEAFVLALVDPAGYAIVYPGCDITQADMNEDGLQNGDDIRPFSAALLGFEPQPVPTPVPNLWQIRQPLPAPVEAPDPGAPEIDVAAEAAGTPPAPEDLEPTIDVQITPEIIDKAAELGSAAAIYEFVRNECVFQAYYGSQKGSLETLRQRCGNDYDLASLLIALLRASEISARYGVGMVELSVGQATGWLAVEDGEVAGSILYTNGMEGINLVSDPDLVAVQCRRVWVEAYTSEGGPPSWMPLDPAFALNAVHEGVDIPEEMGLDAQAFVDEYREPSDPGVTLPRAETVLELLQQEISGYLAASAPSLTLADVRRTHEIMPEMPGELPETLPYIVRSRDAAFSEIPADRRYQVRFHLHDGETNLIDHTVNLPDVAGKRITISYVGATVDDEAIIESYGGLYQTPPSLVDLTPVIRVNGQEEAVGTAPVGMGRVHESDIHFLAPTNDQALPQNVVPAVYNTIVAGASQAIGLAVGGGVAEDLFEPPPADDTEGLASLRYGAAVDYLATRHNAELEFGRLMHAFVTTGVASAIVEDVVDVSYDFSGTPQTFDWTALRIDADRSILGAWPVEGLDQPEPEPKDFMILAGADGSVNQSRVFDVGCGQDSVGTIKILELAVDAGVTIYSRWDDPELPSNTQPASVRSELESAIAAGHVVTFPADPITVGTSATGPWMGTGWIDMDPETGAAGYVISGNNNAGVTVDDWPAEFVDLVVAHSEVDHVTLTITKPAGDSPHAEALFAASGEDLVTLEYEITVHYAAEPAVTLPNTFSRTAHFPCNWLPGGQNIDLGVWVGRWPSWSELASAQRTISTVQIEVTHIKFNYTTGDSADAINIRKSSSVDVLVPEWITPTGPGDDGRNEPAAYKKGIYPNVQARMTITPELNISADVSAINTGGILGNLGETTVEFSNGVSNPFYATFNCLQSTPVAVGIGAMQWQWKAGNFEGGGASAGNMTVTGPHTVYSVLGSPVTPMSEPWTNALDIACEVAGGATTKKVAMQGVWYDFYTNAGGLYDTTSGAAQYTGATSTSFNLTGWLNNYPNVGVVNCYDMGKSVAVFACALGCEAVYTYVSSFGYLNCVHPIGRGWANNPFYDNPGYSSWPIVPGDWGYAQGRSSFGNHGFTRYGNNMDIYDASGGQVDVDDDPDYGPPFEDWDLDGDDNWTRFYKDKVIDDIPSSSTSSPVNYSFSVY